MIDSIELESLLHDLESDRVERKASLSNPDKIRQAICAYANDLHGYGTPGVIFVGVNDDGSCSGLVVDDKLLLTISHMRDDGKILPIPSIEVSRQTIGGCDLVVIIVHPEPNPPVRFDGRTWIRVGPRRAMATPQEERRLSERRRFADLPFDIHPVEMATPDDLDLFLFERVYLPLAVAPDVLEQNQRSMADKLRALRFLAPSGVPTMLGILVLGSDPRRFIPSAYIQFVRFDGTDLTSPIRDQKELDGPVGEMLRRLDELFEAHNEVRTIIDQGRTEIRRPEYPLAALQQLGRNAVMHRTYETTHTPIRIYWFTDRIEIHNPGGPYGQVTRDNFGQPGYTDYRNPHLAEAMKILGYVQRFGIGIQVAQRALADNGNPPAEFTVEPTFVLATLRLRP